MNIAVITGATSGIGREFCSLISQKEPLDQIWCIGRNEERLASLTSSAPNKIRCFSLDLGKLEDLKKLEQTFQAEKNLSICFLVNAAGTGRYGSFEKTALHELLETVRINCEALTAVTALCLPYMKADSHILQIGSAASFFPQPDFAVYSASKAYVTAFSKALAAELKRRRIRITTVCPGPVDTPFLVRSREGIKVPEYKKRGLADPHKVAKQALKDAGKGRTISIYGLKIKLLYFGSRILPVEFFTGITRLLNQKET